MAIPLVVGGTTFNYPVNFDTNWGVDATGWAQAVTNNMLQKTGGSFPLSAEVDFGTSFGLKSLYYKSESASIATTGVLRLNATDTIAFGTSNYPLTTDGSGNLTWRGDIIATSTGDVTSITGTTNQIIASSPTGNVTLSLPQSIALSSSPSFASESLTNTSNQLILGTTHTTTISASVPSASRVYTIPDVGSAANFLLDQGNYTLSGTWTNATLITPALGTPSAAILTNATGLPLTTGVTGILSIGHGGTNASTALSGSSIMVSNGSSIIQGTAGTSTTVLHGNASGTPTYSAVSLTTDVSGTLPVANGGTNSSTALSNGLMIVSAAGAIVEVSSDTSMGNNKITSLKDPTNPQDAATKNYVDNSVNGLDWKQAALLATTTALPTYVYNNGSSGVGATITITATGTLTIDGTIVALNNRVLIKNETAGNAPNNGIYFVSVAGAIGVQAVLTRSLDYNSSADIQAGDAIFIQSGTVNATTSWVQTTTGTIVVGTSNILFNQASGPGAVVINGTTNQINAVTVGTTTTLSTPQNINTAATPTFASETLTATSNQLILGTTQTVTLTAPTPAASRTWSLPDLAVNPTFAALEGTQTFSGSKTFSTNVTISGNHGLIINDNEGTPKTVTIKTPATLTSTYTLTVPVNGGLNNQVLTTDGSGTTSWTNQTGSGTVNSATANQVAYYAASTNAVSGAANVLLNAAGYLTGNILQIQSNSTTTINSPHSIATNAFVSIGPSVSITPKSTTSVILVYASNLIVPGSANVSYFITLQRGASNLFGSNGFIRVFNGPVTNDTNITAAQILYIDSPASTSSQTYQLYGKNSDNTTVGNVGDTNITQYIVAVEIAQ